MTLIFSLVNLLSFSQKKIQIEIVLFVAIANKESSEYTLVVMQGKNLPLGEKSSTHVAFHCRDD
jgi:hypothetical protein